MTRGLAPALVCFVLLVAASASAEVKRYAVVIGNNQPLSSDTTLKPLAYADDDAVRYYQMVQRWGAEAVLLAVLDGDTQRRYPRLPIQARPPTESNLDSAIEALSLQINEDTKRGDSSEFYFIFAGHGAVSEGTSYLALVDAKITQSKLYDEILSRIPATRTHLIVDACHASGVVGSRGVFDKEIDAKTIKASAQQVAGLTRLAQFPSVGVLLATTIGEEAHEWSRIQSGVFSHEVLSGLSGAADVNRDGVIEYSEIQAFVAAANRDLRDRRAAPSVIAIPPKADHHATLVDLRAQKSVAWIQGLPNRLGHFHVELQSGQRYLDANLASAVPVRIAVPADEPLFVRTDTQEARLTASEGEIVQLASLSFNERTVKGRGTLQSQFERNLFASPFSELYYQGFADSSDITAVSFDGPALDYDVSQPRNNKPAAISLLAASGAAVAATALGGGLMFKAKRDYDSANTVAAADSAQSRFKKARTVTIISAAVAAVTGVAGGLLWPRKKAASFRVDVDPSTKRYSADLRVDF